MTMIWEMGILISLYDGFQKKSSLYKSFPIKMCTFLANKVFCETHCRNTKNARGLFFEWPHRLYGIGRLWPQIWVPVLYQMFVIIIFLDIFLLARTSTLRNIWLVSCWGILVKIRGRWYEISVLKGDFFVYFFLILSASTHKSQSCQTWKLLPFLYLRWEFGPLCTLEKHF